MSGFTRLHGGMLSVLAFVAIGVVVMYRNGAALWRVGQPPPAEPAAVESPFTYHFSQDGVVVEAPSIDESSSPYWWVNSGGMMYLEGGVGRTISGDVPPVSKWRILYGRNDPDETDGGLHPQNIFRLVSRSSWYDVRQEIRFRIDAYRTSPSEHRSESNGVLLFSRYVDGADLYYAGVRVDGTAVIKKKEGGAYHTLAQKQVFDGAYDRDASPNLLPVGAWMGIRSDTITDGSTVRIALYLDRDGSGTWEKVLDAIDDGSQDPPIVGSAHVGLRTDFMDVSFDEYRIEAL